MKSSILIVLLSAILSSILTLVAVELLNERSTERFIVVNGYSTDSRSPSAFEQEQKIGEMVKKLQVAIKSPQSKASLLVIYEYGTDSRYYSMIRGWLVQELSAVESQLNASQSEALSKAFTLRADFLKQAIRLIDLE